MNYDDNKEIYTGVRRSVYGKTDASSMRRPPNERRRTTAKLRRKAPKKKRPSGFAIFMITYSLFLLMIVVAGFFLFRKWTASYEETQPYHLAEEVAEAFSDENKLSDFFSEYSDEIDVARDISDVLDCYNDFNNGKAITYSENSDYLLDAPAYSIKADDTVIAKIYLKSKGKTSIGLTEWAISSVEISDYIPAKNTYHIYAPEGFTVYVNDREIADEYIISENFIPDMLQETSGFVDDIPNFTEYLVEVAGNPAVTAKNSSGETFESGVLDGIIYAGCKADDEFIDSVSDIVDSALTSWGGYFINVSWDLPYYILTGCEWYNYIFGGNGYSAIQNYYYTGTYTITDYTFTERNIENYIKYSDSCFSVDVSYKLLVQFLNGERDDDIQELDATWIFIPSMGGWVITDCFYHTTETKVEVSN